MDLPVAIPQITAVKLDFHNLLLDFIWLTG